MKPSNCREVECKYYAEDQSSGLKLFGRKKQKFCHCLKTKQLIRYMTQCKEYGKLLQQLKERMK